jgi:WD40 repeat protein
MSAIFISYTGRDPEGDVWADRLAGWFKEWEYGYFLDKDHSHGIKAGDNWRASLYRELGLATAMVSLCTKLYDKSPWCVGEVAIAVEKGKTVIPILLGQTVEELQTLPLPFLLQNTQAIKLASASNPSPSQLQGVKELLREKLKEKLDWRALQQWESGWKPYPGLQALQEWQAPVFFGRDKMIDAVVERLSSLALRAPSLLLLLGASGFGKSSLVRAGVLPCLRAESHRRWKILTPITPGPFPFQRLCKVLNDAAVPPWDTAVDEDAILRKLQWLHSEAQAPVVLVIDQFEELLSDLRREDEQRGEGGRFLDFLHRLLVEPTSGVLVLATMRTDFLTPLQRERPILVGRASTFTLEPIAREDFEELISGPARRAGLKLQPGLSERLVNDSGGSDALPLLAFTLEKLWQKRQDRGGPVSGARGEQWDLIIDDYTKLGGVEGAVSSRAQDCWDPHRSPADETAALKKAFLEHLVAVGDDGQVVKRPAQMDSLPQASRPILERLVNDRLLVSHLGVVEIAHEALLLSWSPLADWIEEGREDLVVIKQLKPEFTQWQHATKLNKLGALLTGAKLRDASGLLSRPSSLLPSDMRRFINYSLMWKKVRDFLAAISFMVFGVLLSVYFMASHNVDLLEEVANTHQQIAFARENLRTNEAASGMIQTIAATEVNDTDKTVENEILDTLFRALDQANEINQIRDKTGYIKAIALSPDGRQIVSASSNSTLQLWDSKTGKAIGTPFKGHTDWILTVAFSPDGSKIVSGSKDKTLRLWDTSTGQSIGFPFQGHFAEVRSVAFSPDGSLIVSGSADTTLRLWDVKSGQAIGSPFIGHTGWVNSVAFNPDGTQIVSGADDDLVLRWNPITGQVIKPSLQGHTDSVKSVAYSYDGRSIISGSFDKTIRQWNSFDGSPIGYPIGVANEIYSVASSSDGKHVVSGHADGKILMRAADTGGSPVLDLGGHSDTVNSVMFSHDGNQIVSGSDDGTLRVWDASATSFNPTQYVIRGETASYTTAAFSPNGKQIIAGSADNTIRLFSSADGSPIGNPLSGHNGQVTSVSFSPDGRLIVSGSDDKTVRIWDAIKQVPIGSPLMGHEASVASVAFSKDGHKIVSGSTDETVRLWDVKKLQPIGSPLTGHTEQVTSVSFSPNGKRIVSASADKKLIQWNALTGELINVSLGHRGPVLSVAYSSDGLRLVSGSSDKTLQIWDAGTGKPIGPPIKGHSESVTAVAFSPGGHQIISASVDKTLRLWNTYNGKNIGEPLRGHLSQVSSVAFSPDGHNLISSSDDKTLRLWSINPNFLAAKACYRMRNHRLMLEPEILETSHEFQDVARRARLVCNGLGRME